MNNNAEDRQKLLKMLNDIAAQLSDDFMKCSVSLREVPVPSQALQLVDRVFKSWLRQHQNLSAEVSKLLRQWDRLTERQEAGELEKQRLETLFTSGILFSSETEMKSLLGIAIDTVVKELSADAGFIILTNAAGEVEGIFARNMDPEDHPDAKNLSMSIVKNTLDQSEPIRRDDLKQMVADSKQASIVRLGIQSVLCVPLLAETRVVGAVYLDRRDSEHPFDESDLLFLLSFARQIVQGMEISREISLLESRLLQEAQMKFEDLRKEFSCDDIIGSSKRLFEVLRIASKVAPTNASALILGENGTGKELVARAVHRNSRRRDNSFIAINCGAIPADLLESELFGYEAGAFTGANRAKPGKFELADSGTLFLDEIAEMSISLQAKLLRVLQTHELERLGAVQSSKIDVRLLAATNRPIAEMVREGTFREDLYYRLKVIELTVPPLRERPEDIEELAAFFLIKHQREGSPGELDGAALTALQEYAWPGNVRELENVILRGIVLAAGKQITLGDLPPEFQGDSEPSTAPTGDLSLADAELDFRRRYISKVLKKSSSKAEAARILGVNRTHFYRMPSQLEIEL